VFEVTLAARAEATMPPVAANGGDEKPMVVFIADLAYAGIFTLTGVPENQQEPILLVECPRLLFPFARNILADVTRDGGFPPVMLGPIDFVGLWQSRRAQMAPTVANA
jgi:preprotein translocase subunit SecB